MSKKSVDERRSVRAKVLRAAAVECKGRSIPEKVVNLSAHGPQISGPGLPGKDAAVVFRSKGIAIHGWIAWSRPPLAGIHFSNVVDRSDVLRKKADASASIVKDTRKVNHRRPGFRGKQLTDDERQIMVDWRASQ